MCENCKCGGIANTVLMVLILLAIVVFGVLSMKQGGQQQGPGMNQEPPAQTDVAE